METSTLGAKKMQLGSLLWTFACACEVKHFTTPCSNFPASRTRARGLVALCFLSLKYQQRRRDDRWRVTGRRKLLSSDMMRTLASQDKREKVTSFAKKRRSWVLIDPGFATAV